MELGGTIRCSECSRSVDEFTAIAERWSYWSDGCGELLPYCAECARREFTEDALASSTVGGLGNGPSDSGAFEA